VVLKSSANRCCPGNPGGVSVTKPAIRKLACTLRVARHTPKCRRESGNLTIAPAYVAPFVEPY
jgi:hypothetical protein